MAMRGGPEGRELGDGKICISQLWTRKQKETKWISEMRRQRTDGWMNGWMIDG